MLSPLLFYCRTNLESKKHSLQSFVDLKKVIVLIYSSEPLFDTMSFYLWYLHVRYHTISVSESGSVNFNFNVAFLVGVITPLNHINVFLPYPFFTFHLDPRCISNGEGYLFAASSNNCSSSYYRCDNRNHAVLQKCALDKKGSFFDIWNRVCVKGPLQRGECNGKYDRQKMWFRRDWIFVLYL